MLQLKVRSSLCGVCIIRVKVWLYKWGRPKTTGSSTVGPRSTTPKYWRGPKSFKLDLMVKGNRHLCCILSLINKKD